VLLVLSLHLGDQRSVNAASMSPVALAMSNKPIAFIVPTASLQRNIMTYIPLLARNDLHAAQMAYALMPQKDISPHLGRYAYTLDQWTGSSSLL
jgi:hypothetical protein